MKNKLTIEITLEAMPDGRAWYEMKSNEVGKGFIQECTQTNLDIQTNDFGEIGAALMRWINKRSQIRD